MAEFYSKHTFMFPFQWDFITSKKLDYNERTDLKDFDKLFKDCNHGFELTVFEINGIASKYNEYTYFHEFTRKALYYREDNNLLRYYELDKEDGLFNIEYLYEENAELIELSLDSICLHIYDTGVGIVSFNLTNSKYNDKNIILKINEFGRRMYPQYMEEGNPLSTKQSFLPNRIYGSIGELSFDEDFSAYSEPIKVDSTFLPPDYLLKVFGYKIEDRLGDSNQNFVFRKSDERSNTIRIRKVTDDRMFFLSYYNNGILADSLSGNYELNDFWYAYVFGDVGSPTVKNDFFQSEQIRAHSYTRWLDYFKKDPHYHGSIFGVTRDSFVCLGGWHELGYHMQTMYYQMAILCLVQRASILRFSREISQITNQIFQKSKNTDESIQALYENYIRFINQIYFREVTSQIQGIELYNLFQKAMNLEKDAKDLDGEMQELFNYLSVKEQSKLARVAHLFLPITLLVGFFGMNSINDNFFKFPLNTIGIDIHQISLYDVITIGLTIWVIIALITHFTKKSKY